MDEAEGEIWQSKNICLFFFFYWLLQLTPLQSPLWKFKRFSAANFLQTQVLTWKFPRLVKKKSPQRQEKTTGGEIWKYFAIRDWTTFATWSYRYLNPKHVIQRALKLPSVSHTCFFDTTKLYKPLPLFAAFFCAYEVAQSPHENNRSGAKTRSILARFGDNNWEKEEDFLRTFYVKKVVEMGDGGELERELAGWRVKRYNQVAKSELRQNFAKVAKILRLSQKYSKTNPAKL